MIDPAAPIRSLRQRHAAEVDRRGLTILPGTWGFDPDVLGADVVHVILTAEDDALRAPVDQTATDAAFADVLEGDRAAAESLAVAAVTEDLRRRLAGGGSILPD